MWPCPCQKGAWDADPDRANAAWTGRQRRGVRLQARGPRRAPATPRAGRGAWTALSLWALRPRPWTSASGRGGRGDGGMAVFCRLGCLVRGAWPVAPETHAAERRGLKGAEYANYQVSTVLEATPPGRTPVGPLAPPRPPAPGLWSRRLSQRPELPHLLGPWSRDRRPRDCCSGQLGRHRPEMPTGWWQLGGAGPGHGERTGTSGCRAGPARGATRGRWRLSLGRQPGRAKGPRLQ